MQQRHGKALSYNNIVDLEAAWHIVREFDEPAVAIIKHTNPCGAARYISLAYKAFEADEVSAFGSIIGYGTVDLDTATQISNLFVEAVGTGLPMKPLVLSQKQSLRLIEMPLLLSKILHFK